MAKISFFKKIKLFREYRKALLSSKSDLEVRYGLRVDKAYRVYNVLNVPEELIGEAYSVKKSDIDRISENYIKEYLSEISKVLNSKGLYELYSIYEVKKVDKYSYLVVFGFSLFKSNEYYDRLYFRILPAIGISAIIAAIILFLA
jgi:hypothetical protein